MKRQVSFYLLNWYKAGQFNSTLRFQRSPDVGQSGTSWDRWDKEISEVES